MKRLLKNMTVLASAIVTATLTATLVEVSTDQGVFIESAEARLGRPMTPGSVAGVARRTTRRTIRRSTVYINTLPASCQVVVIEGTSLHQCGGTYYQSSGGRYVVVYVN